MIEINLLPHESRKKPAFRLGLPKKYLRSAALLVAGAVIAAQILLQALILIRGLMLTGAQRRISGIRPKMLIVDALREDVRKYRSLEGLFLAAGQPRLRGAPVLNFIASSLPEGMWLSELSLSRDGGEIKGSCFSAQGSEMARIGEFLNALKQDAAAGAVFSKLELSSVQRKKLGPTEVVEFVINSNLKKQPEAGSKKK